MQSPPPLLLPELGLLSCLCAVRPASSIGLHDQQNAAVLHESVCCQLKLQLVHLVCKGSGIWEENAGQLQFVWPSPQLCMDASPAAPLLFPLLTLPPSPARGEHGVWAMSWEPRTSPINIMPSLWNKNKIWTYLLNEFNNWRDLSYGPKPLIKN